MTREIVPGYYLVRLTRGGPPVPAQILWDGFLYRVETDGKLERGTWTPEQAETEWGDSAIHGEAFSHPLLRIVLFGRLVDEVEYRYRCALREWARKHDPEHSAAKPRAKVDLTKQKPVF